MALVIGLIAGALVVILLFAGRAPRAIFFFTGVFFLCMFIAFIQVSTGAVPVHCEEGSQVRVSHATAECASVEE